MMTEAVTLGISIPGSILTSILNNWAQELNHQLSGIRMTSLHSSSSFLQSSWEVTE